MCWSRSDANQFWLTQLELVRAISVARLGRSRLEPVKKVKTWLEPKLKAHHESYKALRSIRTCAGGPRCCPSLPRTASQRLCSTKPLPRQSSGTDGVHLLWEWCWQKPKKHRTASGCPCATKTRGQASQRDLQTKSHVVTVKHFLLKKKNCCL